MKKDIDAIRISVGKRIRALRTRNDLTQTALSEKLDVSKAVISAYEKGIRNPSFENLIRLAEIFDVHVGIFFYDGTPKDPITTLDVSDLDQKQIAVVETVIRSFRSDNINNKED